MDVFFLPSHGTPFCVEIGTSDNVLEIKEKIQKHQGIPVSKQTLIFNAIPLPDDLNVRNTAIQDCSRIHLLLSPDAAAPPPPSSTIRLLLKTTSSKPGITLQADVHDTIQKLKEKIQEMGKVPASQIVLHVNGAVLQDSKTLMECGLSDNSEINASVRRQPSTMMRVFIWRDQWAEKVPAEVIPSAIVGGLRKKMEEMNLDLPKEYFFIHKQYVMEDDMSFGWHQVRQGDMIEVFPGSVSRRPASGEQW